MGINLDFQCLFDEPRRAVDIDQIVKEPAKLALDYFEQFAEGQNFDE
jgi:hypothetical protein